MRYLAFLVVIAALSGCGGSNLHETGEGGQYRASDPAPPPFDPGPPPPPPPVPPDNYNRGR